jgi:hypothetical protein
MASTTVVNTAKRVLEENRMAFAEAETDVGGTLDTGDRANDYQ